MKAWIVVYMEDYGGDRFQHAFSSKKKAEAYVAEHCAGRHRCYYGVVCWELNEGEC